MRAMGVTLISEGNRLQQGRIRREDQFDGRPPYSNLPLAIASLESVQVPATNDTGRHPIMIQEAHQHVALAMRSITLDLTQVCRDVVGMDLRSSHMHEIDPFRIFGRRRHREAVLIDAIIVVCGCESNSES